MHCVNKEVSTEMNERVQTMGLKCHGEDYWSITDHSSVSSPAGSNTLPLNLIAVVNLILKPLRT